MSYDLTNLKNPELLIFEIDDPTFRRHARFVRALDERDAMGEMRYPVEIGQGMWEGVLSTCYVMSSWDFRRHWEFIKSYVAGQDAILATIGRLGRLEAPDRVLATGVMHRVSLSAAEMEKGFTLLASGAYVFKADGS